MNLKFLIFFQGSFFPYLYIRKRDVVFYPILQGDLFSCPRLVPLGFMSCAQLFVPVHEQYPFLCLLYNYTKMGGNILKIPNRSDPVLQTGVV